MRKLYTFYVFACLLFLFPVTGMLAGDVEPSDSVVHAWLPFARYDSDLGIVAGGLWNRFHYEDGVTPYRNVTETRAQASTRGRIQSRVAHERLNAFGTPFRIRGEIEIERLLFDNYFGVGNDTEMLTEEWEDRWYNYESRIGIAFLRARYPLLPEVEGKHLDVLMLTGGYYYEALELDDYNSLLFEDVEGVNDNQFMAYVGTGILWDSRNNEFDPRQGLYGEVDFRFYPEFISGNGSMHSISSDLRGFYTIEQLGDLTAGVRIGGEWADGHVPFWLLPELGGEETMRGFHLRRFRDNAVIFNSISLRKWWVSFDFLNLRIGNQAFLESGRTFSGDEPFEEAFNNYHHAIGGSLLLSAFTDDFIIRADYSRSVETVRIYVNTGFVY